MKVALLVLALLAIACASNEDVTANGEKLLAAVQQSTCGTGGLSFSALTQTTGATDYTYATSDKHYTWYLNVCADTIAPCLGDTKTAPGVWNYNYQQSYACFNLGDKTQGTWSGAAADGSYVAAVKYVGGDACYNTQPASQYTIQMNFACDATATKPRLDTVVAGATQCDYIATFKTSIACSGGAGGGAGAWAFNIIVLAGIPTYFAVGYLYLWKAKGAEGSDRIPNYAFWADLPSLIKDGCLYFIYMCKLVCFKIGILSLPPDAPIPSAPATYGGSSSYSDSSTPSSYGESAPPAMGMSAGSSGAYGTI